MGIGGGADASVIFALCGFLWHGFWKMLRQKICANEKVSVYLHSIQTTQKLRPRRELFAL